MDDDLPVITAFTLPPNNGVYMYLTGDRHAWLSVSGEEATIFNALPAASVPEFIVKFSLARMARAITHHVWRKRAARLCRQVKEAYPPTPVTSPFADRTYVLWLIKQVMSEHYVPDLASHIYSFVQQIAVPESDGSDARVTKFLV